MVEPVIIEESEPEPEHEPEPEPVVISPQPKKFKKDIKQLQLDGTLKPLSVEQPRVVGTSFKERIPLTYCYDGGECYTLSLMRARHLATMCVPCTPTL